MKTVIKAFLYDGFMRNDKKNSFYRHQPFHFQKLRIRSVYTGLDVTEVSQLRTD